METDDLICALSRDCPCTRAKFLMRVWGTLIGILAAFVVVTALTLGFRADLGGIMDNPVMMMKYGVMAVMLVCSGIGWWASGHPQGRKTALYMLGLIAALWVALLLTALHTWQAQGTAAIMDDIFNRNAFYCVAYVTGFGLIASVVLTRIGASLAPECPYFHAAMTGLFGAVLGAVAYGLHCPHDIAAYFLMWYCPVFAVVSAACVRLWAKKLSW